MSFSTWIRNHVSEMDQSGMNPDLSLQTMSRLPSRTVKHYNSMWAYGYHLRTDDEQGRAHVSFDSGVAAIITQECRSSRADQHPVEAWLKYVGIIKDIVQLDYGLHKYTVRRCSWVKPNQEGASTMRRDNHGFWSLKFDARQSHDIEPYILPAHVQQVINNVVEVGYGIPVK